MLLIEYCSGYKLEIHISISKSKEHAKIYQLIEKLYKINFRTFLLRSHTSLVIIKELIQIHFISFSHDSSLKFVENI